MALEHECPPTAPGQQVQPCLQGHIPSSGMLLGAGGDPSKWLKAAAAVVKGGAIRLEEPVWEQGTVLLRWG